MISRYNLISLYCDKKYSSKKIAELLSCSANKVNYWLKKHQISKRTIAEAVYVKHNPKGDPFSVRSIPTNVDSFLYGLGLGLFWGEGNKMSKNSVRLGNTDPKLIKTFLRFLCEIYRIKKEDLKFGLQIFNDIDPRKALSFWRRELGVSVSQFQKKIVISKIRGPGTYRSKSKHGVLTLYFHNTKLRNIIRNEIEKL